MSSFFRLKWGVQILCLFKQNQTPPSDSGQSRTLRTHFLPPNSWSPGPGDRHGRTHPCEQLHDEAACYRLTEEANLLGAEPRRSQRAAGGLHCAALRDFRFRVDHVRHFGNRCPRTLLLVSLQCKAGVAWLADRPILVRSNVRFSFSSLTPH